jgi:hypothetical protein
MVRISVVRFALALALVACSGASSGTPSSGTADAACGPLQYISAGACLPLRINGPPDAAVGAQEEPDAAAFDSEASDQAASDAQDGSDGQGSDAQDGSDGQGSDAQDGSDGQGSNAQDGSDGQ